jgi:hypothetical protein
MLRTNRCALLVFRERLSRVPINPNSSQRLVSSVVFESICMVALWRERVGTSNVVAGYVARGSSAALRGLSNHSAPYHMGAVHARS